MDNNNNTAIKIEHVSKSFRIPLEGSNGIKQKLINHLKGRVGYRDFTPLNDISFEIKKGEFFGIVGRNGSGKSTLLKTIAGIYSPNKGSVQVNGTLVPFIELGVGFNPELTGRENIFLNGALLGFKHSEMEKMYDSIVDFAELHDFMDERLKNYSSGMQVRLAFSIAIRAQGDILLLDEVLAVGDEAFQQKCNDYFAQIKEENRTVILVTHSMDAVKRFCTRALLIEDGKISAIGSPDEIANQYTLDNMNGNEVKDHLNSINSAVKELKVIPKSPQHLKNTEELIFDVEYTLNKPVPVDIEMSLLYENISVIKHSTKNEKKQPNYQPHIKHRVSYKYPLNNLNSGKFRIVVSMFEKNEEKRIKLSSEEYGLIIENIKKNDGGIMSLRGTWYI